MKKLNKKSFALGFIVPLVYFWGFRVLAGGYGFPFSQLYLQLGPMVYLGLQILALFAVALGLNGIVTRRSKKQGSGDMSVKQNRSVEAVSVAGGVIFEGLLELLFFWAAMSLISPSFL